MSYFHAYGQVSQPCKKFSYHIFIQQKNLKKNVLACLLSFNDQFIKVMRTRPLFQKYQKKLFCFLLISRITNLYVRCIPSIK